MVSPELGFTSDVIRDPERFVGRHDVLKECIRAVNSELSLLAIYGKRGVGKSSLLRQVQQMALGDYSIAQQAGLGRLIPERPRKYLTVFYTCDSFVKDAESLLQRLSNDEDPEDGLLRLIPDDGKQLVEFTRTKEVSGGLDLKVASLGAKGTESSKYAKIVPGDIVQTFRNFVSAVVTHQVKARMKRDGLLILLDEFDVVEDKSHLGSLIKSMSSNSVKFAICGVARDLTGLVRDHASVERLLEEGAVHLRPMPNVEARAIVETANQRFQGQLEIHSQVMDEIVRLCEGYPYLVQMFGKACVTRANQEGTPNVDMAVLKAVLEEVRDGSAFPTLESAYQVAIGSSEGRQLLLHLLAEQPEDRARFNDEVGKVVLKKIRSDAQELGVDYIDQLMPRLVDRKFGPVLVRQEDGQGVYEFANPILRLYVRLRNIT